MQFKPYLAELAAIGQKTQTRRLKKPTDTTVCCKGHIVAVYRNNRLLWRVGQTYAIQPGRGKKAIGRLHLRSIRQEQLQDITIAGAMAEGIGHANVTEAFSQLWDHINTKFNTRWQDNPNVFVLTFEPTPGEAQ